MRKYGKDGRLDCVICNRCGKKLAVKHGIVREGVFTSDHRWDFFSEKDGEVHHFDLCEDCYDEMTAEFRIPVDVEDEIELLCCLNHGICRLNGGYQATCFNHA